MCRIKTDKCDSDRESVAYYVHIHTQRVEQPRSFNCQHICVRMCAVMLRQIIARMKISTHVCVRAFVFVQCSIICCIYSTAYGKRSIRQHATLRTSQPRRSGLANRQSPTRQWWLGRLSAANATSQISYSLTCVRHIEVHNIAQARSPSVCTRAHTLSIADARTSLYIFCVHFYAQARHNAMRCQQLLPSGSLRRLLSLIHWLPSQRRHGRLHPNAFIMRLMLVV